MRFTTLSKAVTNTPAVQRFERAIAAIGQLAMHEAEFLDRHWLALRERVVVARKARDAGELLRNQVDLLPATTARLAQDHRIRRKLWRELGSRLK